MERKICNITIDQIPYQFEVEGDFFWGQEELLFQPIDSLISKTSWKELGFGIVKAFSEEEFKNLHDSVTRNIVNAIKMNGILIDEDSFSLEQYHEVVSNDEDHFKVIQITRNLSNEDFDFDIELLVDRFSEALGYPLTSYIEALKRSHIQLRINRPNSLDINPPHKDGYLSFWEDIVNVWIPIAGCNQYTSLPVVLGSHLWNENTIYRTEGKGAKINGNTYNVPCILKTSSGNLEMIRPNPSEGEALIFSPFLIHGAAANFSNHCRISMELRFPRLKT